MERIPWKSDNDWKKLIISPPRSVNDAYATLLQNVPEDERYSVKILLHLMVAAFRPLTLRETNIALVVRGSLGENDENVLGLQSESEFKSWVLQTCGFFVTVYGRKLDFIHQTAKEFLFGFGPMILWQQGPDRLSPMTDKAAHKIIAESSIAYLSLKCFNSKEFHERARPSPAGASARIDSQGRSRAGTRKGFRKIYGFLDYTSEYWFKHFRLCQSFDGTNFQDVGDEFIPHYMSLFTSTDEFAPGWMFLHSSHTLRSLLSTAGDLTGGYKMFNAALWFDHIRLLEYDLSHNTSDNKFLLHSAAAQNAENCVQYLAAIGHDINAQDETGATALCLAAHNKSTETVSVLLDYNADVNLGEGPQKRPLSYFEPYYGPEQLKLVRRLVCQGADLNNTTMTTVKMETNMTPLAWAAQIAHPSTLAHDDSMRRLDRWIHEELFASDLEHMADRLGHLDLFAAEEFLEAYDTSLIKLFLDHGAHIDGADPSWSSGSRDIQYPMTALEVACRYAWRGPGSKIFWNAVFLLHGGANSRINTETGNSALDWLLRSPADLGFTMPQHYNTDLFPLSRDNLDRWNVLTMHLLKQDSASDYINDPISANTMHTRLHSLCTSHDVSRRQEKVKLLVRHGAGVNCQDVSGKTPMHYLSSYTVDTEACEVIEILVENGADLEIRDSLGRTPTHYVRSAMVFDTLAKIGADIEARDNQGNTPLQAILADCGAEFGPEMIQSLVAVGADTTVRNCAGETLLHTAATSGFVDRLLYLLQAGIDLDVTNDRSETPLQAALNNRCHAAAALLLEKGADSKPLLQRGFDTEQRDWRTGTTLLFFVSGSHTHHAMSTLLRRGANPNALPTADDSDFKSHLDRLDCIRDVKAWVFTEMLRSPVRQDIIGEASQPWNHVNPDHRNLRPLHLAMRNGWTRDAGITVDLLLRYGADIEARSRSGQTPLQVACHHGNEGGVRMLLKYGANACVRAPRWDDTPLGILCQAWQPNPGLIRALVTHGAMSDLGSLDGAALFRISCSWSNRARGSEETSRCRAGDSDAVRYDVTTPEDQSSCQCRKCRRDHESRACAMVQNLLDAGTVNHDVTVPKDQSRCHCPECRRDHESRACAAVQTLLDAGAWIQLRDPLQKRDSWTKDIDTPRYWGWDDLATVLEQGGVPKWRRAWMPPNTRRRSWPAAKPDSLHLNAVDQATGEEDTPRY